MLFYTVGGKREEGESDLEALAREVLEEAGVELRRETARLLHAFEGPAHGIPDGILKMACYCAAYDGELAPANEVAELAWFTTADMHRTTPVGQDILRWLHGQDLID